MPLFCCVVGCSCRGGRDNVSFYRIPKPLKFKHKPIINNLSRLRHEKWLLAIKRQDLTEAKIKHARVCSRHFISGKPAALVDTENPDWIPTVAEMDLLYDTKCGGEGEVISDGIKVEVVADDQVPCKGDVAEDTNSPPEDRARYK